MGKNPNLNTLKEINKIIQGQTSDGSQISVSPAKVASFKYAP
jgi:hypothetical protein